MKYGLGEPLHETPVQLIQYDMQALRVAGKIRVESRELQLADAQQSSPNRSKLMFA